MFKNSSFIFVLFISFILSGCTTTIASYEDEDVRDNEESNNNNEGKNDDIELRAELSCDSLSFCSNYTIQYESIELPEQLGGSISDGVYRVIEGTNVFYGLMFKNGKFSYLWPDLTVTHGDFSVDENDLLLSSHTYCSRNSVNDPSDGLEEISSYKFAVDGDRLYLRGQCGPPNGCPSATVFEKVESLCENLSSYDCSEGGCTCAQFVEESVPSSVSLDAGCVI